MVSTNARHISEVHVLFPHSENLKNSCTNEEYDEAYVKRFINWVMRCYPLAISHLVTLSSINSVLDDISERAKSSNVVVFNLCDSVIEDSSNEDAPGITVVRELERRGLVFTGSDEKFWLNSASKERAKDLMLAANVPTSPFVRIHPASVEQDIEEVMHVVKAPWMCKLGNDGGSSGVVPRSVCYTREEMRARVMEMFALYPGRTVFVERFLSGREFSVFVFQRTKDGSFKHFVPIERSFKNPLQIRTEDIELNDICCTPLCGGNLRQELEEIAERAHVAVGGRHYSRVDIREDSDGHLQVLEVNAQPGIYSEEGAAFTHILQASNVDILEFIRETIDTALDQ